jgi:hypothetical protein
MTMPPVYPPRVGMNPQTADEVNMSTGALLRQYVEIMQRVSHNAEWFAGVDLKAEPYNMTAELEGTIKSAVIGLDTALEGVDMTFINRLIGIW